MGIGVRQRIMKALYPLVMRFGKAGEKGKVLVNSKKVLPKTPVAKLKAVGNRGSQESLAQWAGKKVLVVNTASNCGFTGQFAELEQLYQQYQGQLVVVGFPANDFREQEKGSDQEIAEFCQLNYGVTFPLMKKSQVVKGERQNPVFKWLSDKGQNGWNDQAPSWNFSKYLLDEQGVLTHYFGPAVSPLQEEVLRAVTES